MELVFSQLIFGRPSHSTPGFRPNGSALRPAFMAALTDKDTSGGGAHHAARSRSARGRTVQAEVAKAYGMPARIVERAEQQSLIYRPQ